MTKLPRVPDLDAQREVMKKLGFLVGKWAGEARLLRGPDEWAELIQTEEVEYKLDGLIMVIEGVGRRKSSGRTVLQAFGIISYDDESRTITCVHLTMAVFLEPQRNCWKRVAG